ncbi:MAG: GNAT family N-acetyltransferase [Oscillospiraceae bacterium]|jgi:predicted acetyltransferase|nr:GNAT family N-acetyltransferase [Oscillospiraceae bacterium]
METLKLVVPSIAYADEITAYRQEFLDAGDSMDGCAALEDYPDIADWLHKIQMHANKDSLPENRVLATQFLYVREEDNKLVGMIDVRHYFNDFLERFGGHIGYSVRPSERRRGYATTMLHDCLPYCRQLGLAKVLITCDADNDGSRKTILANGGVYESTVFEQKEKNQIERYWIPLL